MTSKRVHLVLALGVALLFGLMASPAFAGLVEGTKHDLSTTGPDSNTNATRHCVFCHTPHQDTLAGAQDPLWNHQLSAVAAYTFYESDTMDATDVSDIGGATAGTAKVSNLCMSCHDGTVAINTLYNDPNETTTWVLTDSTNVVGGLIINSPNLGTDLSDDHPINFNYDSALATLDGELNIPDSLDFVDVAGNVPLFEGTGSLQCASCHDPHDNQFPPFMVVDNTKSALCTTCHAK